MSTRARHGGTDRAASEPRAAPSLSALALVAAGMAAAWFAAGSTGLFDRAMQNALTWSALGVAVLLAIPRERRPMSDWATLAGGVLLGALFTASSSVPAVNVFAVAVVLGAIAVVGRGVDGRVALIVAFGALGLALIRFASDYVPIVWLAADFKGAVAGQLVGRLVGKSLDIGASFAGLDYVAMMAVIYAGWLIGTAPPRRSRALWAAVAILVTHAAYLAILAHHDTIFAALPAAPALPESDINNVGHWTWAGGLRTLIPWNLPLLLTLAYIAIAVSMFRRSTWLPVSETKPVDDEELSDKALMADILFHFGPVILTVAAPLALMLTRYAPDLGGRNVLAYDAGKSAWAKPSLGAHAIGRYGAMAMLCEDLGGRFIASNGISEQELAEADVLVVFDAPQTWPTERLERVWKFVRGGGSLLLAADADAGESSQNACNALLEPTAMRVQKDAAPTQVDNWGQTCEMIGLSMAAESVGAIDRFGRDCRASVTMHWPARPVVARRWGLSGDSVLVAEQRLGAGRVLLFADDSLLRNHRLAEAYPQIGRLLVDLAGKQTSLNAGWRQLLSLGALVSIAVLLALRPSAWQVLIVAVALPTSLWLCTSAMATSSRVLPDGRSHTGDRFNNVAYIDASHMESYSADSRSPHGLGNFLQLLIEQGYLPLYASDVTPERLQRAGLFVSIAPLRKFSAPERAAVKHFVTEGGTFLCMVGAEEARPSAPLLAEFGFAVPPSPVPAREKRSEPAPLGNFAQRFDDSQTRFVQFYAGWPIECEGPQFNDLVVWSDGKTELPVVVGRREGRGTVAVIADTYFAANENLELRDAAPSDNRYFWPWLLSRVVPGRQVWNPPPRKDETPTSDSRETSAAEGTAR